MFFINVVPINGKVALETALSQRAAAFEERGARIMYDTLPSISADVSQLVQREIDAQIMSVDPRLGNAGFTAM